MVYYLHIEKNIPQDFQFTMSAPEAGREQLHAGILQIVGAEVQLSQTEGDGAEDGGQSFTASLRQVTAI